MLIFRHTCPRESLGGLGPTCSFSSFIFRHTHFPAYSFSGHTCPRDSGMPIPGMLIFRHTHFPACSFSGILIFRQNLFGGLGPTCSCSGSSSGMLICRLIFLLIFQHAHFPAYWSPRFQLIFLIIFRLNCPTCFFASFPGSVSGSFSGMLIFRHAHSPSYLSPKTSKQT